MKVLVALQYGKDLLPCVEHRSDHYHRLYGPAKRLWQRLKAPTQFSLPGHPVYVRTLILDPQQPA